MAGNSRKLSKREACQPIYKDVVGTQTHGGADGIVVRKFDMREPFIPVVLERGDDRYRCLGHTVWFTRPTPPLLFGW